VKSASLPARVTRHLGNLSERRHTAEYSSSAAWEFTSEEALTYLDWMKEPAIDIIKELQKTAPEHADRLKEINAKLINA
jgi:hypothetical protein